MKDAIHKGKSSMWVRGRTFQGFYVLFVGVRCRIHFICVRFRRMSLVGGTHHAFMLPGARITM